MSIGSSAVKRVIPGLFCFVLAACGGGGSGGSSTTATTDPNPAPGDTSSATGQATVLEGAWAGGACEDVSDDNSADVFFKDSYTYTGNAAVITTDFFADSNCATPVTSVDQSGFGFGFVFPDQIRATATFVIGDGITTSNGTPATEINYQNVSAVDASNGRPLPADLTPASDLFDIFSINASGNLFFAGNASNAQGSRPQQLNFFNAFVQQGGGTVPPDSEGQAIALEGTWAAACDVLVANELFFTQSSAFTGNTQIAVINFFADSGCVTPIESTDQSRADLPLPNQIRTTVTFVTGNNVTTNGGLTATEIDFQTVSLTDGNGGVLSDQLVSVFGDSASFDIFYIDASGNLFFGDGIGSTAATRPTALDLAASPFVRQ